MTDPYAPHTPVERKPGPPQALSITAMVLGLVGLAFGWAMFGFPSLAAVIVGHLGLKREPEGRPFSITGLVTGYIGLAVAVFVAVFAIAAFLIPLLLVGGLAVGGSSYS